MITLICIAALVLAAARMTLVVTWDKITFGLRVWIARKSEKSRIAAFFDNMLACVWCAGFHVSWLLTIPPMFVFKWEYELQTGKTLPIWVILIVWAYVSGATSWIASKLASGVNDGV